MEWIMKRVVEADGTLAFKYVPAVEPEIPQGVFITKWMEDHIFLMWNTQIKAGLGVNKVEAIKLIREITGAGLKPAKDAIDVMAMEFNLKYPQETEAVINVRMTTPEHQALKALLGGMANYKMQDVLTGAHITHGSSCASEAACHLVDLSHRL